LSHTFFVVLPQFLSMPQIRLPAPPVPRESKSLSLDQIARRWRTRVSIARILLLRAGVPLIDVPRAPTEGVLLEDLEAYEERLRQGEEVCADAGE
jgi:hypothetical protein